MNEMHKTGTPWHLWLVGIIAVLWNSIGAMDFAATMTNFEPYLKDLGQLSDADIAFFQSFPPWHDALWMIGTWGGLIGSILLLMKNKFAVPVLAASLIGAVIALGRIMMMKDVPASADGGLFPIIIWVIAAGLVAYAIWMRRRGVLR